MPDSKLWCAGSVSLQREAEPQPKAKHGTKKAAARHKRRHEEAQPAAPGVNLAPEERRDLKLEEPQAAAQSQETSLPAAMGFQAADAAHQAVEKHKHKLKQPAPAASALVLAAESQAAPERQKRWSETVKSAEAAVNEMGVVQELSASASQPVESQTAPDANPSDWWTSAYASAFSLERLRTPDNDMRLLNICIAAAGAVYSPAELYMAMGMQPLKLAPQHQVASWL